MGLEDVEERLFMAYLAGMIDGDGALYVQKKGKKGNHVPVITIAVSCEELIMFLLKKLGGTVSMTRNLPRWSLRKRKEVISLLDSLNPYLIEKKEIALAVKELDYDRAQILNKITIQDTKDLNPGFKTDEAWAYTAGFVDADGHISIKKRLRNEVGVRTRYFPDYELSVGFGGSDFRSTSMIANFFGRGCLKIRPHKRCTNSKRLDFRLRKHLDVKEFVEGCLPYLLVKKENAEVILEYINGYSVQVGSRTISSDQLGHREGCFRRIKLLQRRGCDLVKPLLMDLNSPPSNIEANKAEAAKACTVNVVSEGDATNGVCGTLNSIVI